MALLPEDIKTIEELIDQRVGKPPNGKEGRESTVWAALERVAGNLDCLTDKVAQLAEAQARTERLVEELAQAQARTERRVEELAQAQARTENTLAGLKGRVLEAFFGRKAHSYFGRFLRKVCEVSFQDLEDHLESTLDREELLDLLQVDVLVCGKPRDREPAREVYLAVEISSVVDRNDVARARKRADSLRKAGYNALAAVAGERLTEGAESQAARLRVVVVEDGRIRNAEPALAELS